MNEVVQVRMNGWVAMVNQKNESGMTVKNGVLSTVSHSTLITIVSVSFEKECSKRCSPRHLILLRSFIKLKRLKLLQELVSGSDVVKL